jgi:hypothetical protein
MRQACIGGKRLEQKKQTREGSLAGLQGFLDMGNQASTTGSAGLAGRAAASHFDLAAEVF